MSHSTRANVIGAGTVCVLVISLLSMVGCAGTKGHKGRAASSQTSEAGFTNWFGTSVAPGIQAASKTNLAPSVAVDNTAQNKRDADAEALTPFDQGSTGSDRAITASLRKSIALPKGDHFSFDAKNIKIVTINGVVTLRGVVASDDEKARIGALAKQVPGIKQINNLLEPKANKEP